MTKHIVIMGLFVAAVILALMFLINDSSFDPAAQKLDPLPADPVPGQLFSMNGSGQSGQVYAARQDSKVLLVAELTSGSLKQSQPVFIHTGTCSQLSTAKYQLPIMTNGRMETVSAAPVDELQALGDLSLVIYKSVDGRPEAASCANLSELLDKTKV